MTTFLLIRHASPNLNGPVLAGRMPEVGLCAEGQAEAERLAEHLARWPIRTILSSPLKRARQTAEPLARFRGLPVQVCDELVDIDFGEWTGRTVDELEPLDEWQAITGFRSGARFPGGESLREVQSRTLHLLERRQQEQPDALAALFSHSDVIRVATAYYLGVPLDLAHRMEIDPASITALEVTATGARVLCVNCPCPAEMPSWLRGPELAAPPAGRSTPRE